MLYGGSGPCCGCCWASSLICIALSCPVEWSPKGGGSALGGLGAAILSDRYRSLGEMASSYERSRGKEARACILHCHPHSRQLWASRSGGCCGVLYVRWFPLATGKTPRGTWQAGASNGHNRERPGARMRAGVQALQARRDLDFPALDIDAAAYLRTVRGTAWTKPLAHQLGRAHSQTSSRRRDSRLCHRLLGSSEREHGREPRLERAAHPNRRVW
jgi:hypothetical protein